MTPCYRDIRENGGVYRIILEDFNRQHPTTMIVSIFDIGLPDSPKEIHTITGSLHDKDSELMALGEACVNGLAKTP